MSVVGRLLQDDAPRLAPAPRPDIDRLSAAFRKGRRVQIPDFLSDETARRLQHCLAQEIAWQTQSTDGGRRFELFPNQLEAMTDTHRKMLLDIVHRTAEQGFQYFYDGYPIFEAAQEGTLAHPLLRAVHDLVNGEDFLGLMRRLIGRDDIAFADCQATCYRRGHFLTRHDDAVAGKNRIAAYVLNLTPYWRADWGGILEFFEDNRLVGGYVPGFNILNVFAVPTDHAVSYVTPFAGAERHAITGWLRAGAP
ncbi:MAG: 2OG-Fe(II) oxygenase family protein [Rhodothalassiaceae bacterium]